MDGKNREVVLNLTGLILTKLGRLHTHTGFLPESDPALVVEFFTSTGITAAGGQFDFEHCTRKCLYIEIGS